MKKQNTTKFTTILLFALSCFALCPMAQAVSPPPDGCYPGFTTAEGCNAVQNLTTGAGNTGVGWHSLFGTSTGNYNTGVGAGTLVINNGDSNTATGAAALLLNTSGTQNTAVGTDAMVHNDTGTDNTAVGAFALFNNIDGSGNTAVGVNALFSHTAVGPASCAFGGLALYSDQTGQGNSAFGGSALYSNISGGFNTAVGTGALAFSNGGYNIALGVNSGSNVTTASSVICIGASGANVDNSFFVANVYSNVQPIVGTDPDSVTITSSGRLGRGNVSSRRYKHDIQPMEKASEVLYALKPVSFRYNKEYDAMQTLAFGLIAEEVAEVYPDLVGRNPEGEPESVRYEQVNAMLLNEFLKEHKKVQELEATMAQQRKSFESRLAQQQTQIESLSAGLQKVSAQIEMSRAPQVVVNP
jgi:hypothetical protein